MLVNPSEAFRIVLEDGWVNRHTLVLGQAVVIAED
jgi:hypothetical protein